MEHKLSVWALHYASWMISDGCPERKVGEIFDWVGVQFWNENRLVKTSDRDKSAILVADFKYQVVAEVAYWSNDSCVIDFGLSAIGTPNLLEDGCRLGDYVTGETHLSLPLSTEIAADAELETLKHRWQINRIQADLTPYVERIMERRYFVRDESQIRFEDVRTTHDVKASNYVLICSEVV